ncbi:SPRY domain-containing SOCS box protein 3-like [Nylanderia fulva]|uniref:SPRY domain-containing SOCS box protein 3-like n=1 Tax=Nylanderia fulva TaxID=613905 RepID=UPI0010FBB9E0|nr:SPRY domain-containing SOCS box protein 3-like [Nylanderia fulva]
MDLVSNNQQTEADNDYEWTWDKEHSTSSTHLSNNNLNVTFHPVYSTGTAVVRGNKLLEKGRHHFWEVLMMTGIYGTDVMIGVGTANAKLNVASNYFCALLGQDQESWGFSYRGYVQHNSKKFKYGDLFDQGQIVGIHLDAWSGMLEFFIDRKPLGVAYTQLNNVALYPLISSTMAQCKMRLIRSCSIPASLQTACLSILSPSQKAYLSKMFPGLRYLSESIFAGVLQKFIDYKSEDDMEYPAEYVILDDFDFALVGLGVKKRKYH